MRSLAKKIFWPPASLVVGTALVFVGWPWGNHKALAAPTFITSGTTWTVPSDWNNSSNSIEVIAGGGGGGNGGSATGAGGGGGGGGAYSEVTNATLTSGNTVSVAVGSGGVAGSGASSTGGDTYLCNSTSNCSSISGSSVVVGAKGGLGGGNASGSTPGVGVSGGLASNGIGTGFNGGSSAAGSSTSGQSGGGGGGGGGAAGLNGAGNNGSAGSGATGGTGGTADTGLGGGASRDGSEWDSTHGSGGGATGGTGGGKGVAGFSASSSGAYGGGGGGGGGAGRNGSGGGSGSYGQQGLIVVKYTPIPTTYNQTSYQWLANADSVTPGGKLNNVGQNTPATLTSTGEPFRLRQLIKPSVSIGAGYQSFNEQYAALGSYGSCSVIPDTYWTSLNGGDSGPAGPDYAGTAVNDANGGTQPWGSASNATGPSDSVYATIGNLPNGATSNYLDATNYTFSIPSNATITGISVVVNASSITSSTGMNAQVNLIKGGAIQPTTKSAPWPTTGVIVMNFGGSSDMWGTTLTPTDVNSSNFGAALQAISTGGGFNAPEVDDLAITVSYTLPTSGGLLYYDNPTPVSGGAISATASDPTDSGQTVSPQTYQEADGFTNTSTIGGSVDGEWDLSLYDNGAPAGTTYCFRTVKADGTPLDTYSYYPMITTAPSTDMLMRGGQYFNNGVKQPYFWAQ